MLLAAEKVIHDALDRTFESADYETSSLSQIHLLLHTFCVGVVRRRDEAAPGGGFCLGITASGRAYRRGLAVGRRAPDRLPSPARPPGRPASGRLGRPVPPASPRGERRRSASTPGAESKAPVPPLQRRGFTLTDTHCAGSMPGTVRW
jgi:hypothetical protein